jgi:hypothetical protein
LLTVVAPTEQRRPVRRHQCDERRRARPGVVVGLRPGNDVSDQILTNVVQFVVGQTVPICQALRLVIDLG